MEDIEKLIENTYQSDPESLEEAANGFQPNSTIESEKEEIQSIGLDYENNFIEKNHNN